MLAAGTHKLEPFVPFVVPDFQMLGNVDDAFDVDELGSEHTDLGPPPAGCTFRDGPFGFFFFDALQANSVGVGP